MASRSLKEHYDWSALFHDLRHLPFSHGSEYALQDFASSREAAGKSLPPSTREIANAKAPHEEIGHALADIVLDSCRSRIDGCHFHSLARQIQTSPDRLRLPGPTCFRLSVASFVG